MTSYIGTDQAVVIKTFFKSNISCLFIRNHVWNVCYFSTKYAVSLKTSPSIICVIFLSDVIRLCEFLAETYPRKFETSLNTQPTTSRFYMFALYVVKTGNNIYGIQHNVKYQVVAQKSSCYLRQLSSNGSSNT